MIKDNEKQLEILKKVIDLQDKNIELWLPPETSAEDCLQKALLYLHTVIKKGVLK